MARIRTVKPEFWKHEELSALPESVHMLAAALLNYSDDEGYFNANDKLVKAECCPLRESSVSVHDALIMLSNVGYIRLGSTPDGKRYGHVVNFEEHQRVNRKTKSKIKSMGIVWDASVSTHSQLTEDSPPEGKGKEGNGIKRAEARDYVFDGGIIKLGRKHFDDWTKAYPNIDLRGELTARDAWLGSPRAKDSDRENWFISTSKYLANRNMEARAKVVALQPGARPLTPSGQPWPDGIV